MPLARARRHTDCTLGLRGLCPVPRVGLGDGGGASATGRRSTRILLELAHCGPSRDMGTDGMLSCSPAAGGERGPAVSCGDSGSGALFGRNLRVAACPGHRGSAKRVVWAAGAAPPRHPSLPAPSPSHPSTWAQGPRKGNCGLGHTGLAWPQGPPSPGPREAPPGWAGSMARGPAVCPSTAPSCPCRRAPPRLPHAPRASRAAVCGVAPSPRGLGRRALPSVCSLPGVFLCRFLNVILKSGK